MFQSLRFKSAGSNGHALSRRRFLQAAAGTIGVLGAGLAWPARARADEIVAPNPIPGGDPSFNAFSPPSTELLHVYAPDPFSGFDPITITDFDGVVGAAIVDGTGRGRGNRTHGNRDLLFEVDLRFMQGTYRGIDGRAHFGTFALV
jgi:hypothetical protein